MMQKLHRLQVEFQELEVEGWETAPSVGKEYGSNMSEH